MDFIKKHFEKLLLTAALLALTGVTGFLAYRVNELSKAFQQSGLFKPPTPKSSTSLDINLYTNAIAGLQQPSLWQTSSVDPWGTERTQVVQQAAIVTNKVEEPFSVESVARKRFELLFTAYRGNGEEIQINFPARRHSFFGLKVGGKVADSFFDTGYTIKEFKHIERKMQVKGVGERTIDLSELTVQAGDAPAVVLVLNKWTEREPEVRLVCLVAAQASSLHRGDTTTCGEKTYKVVDITQTQVIIEDTQSKEKHTIEIPRAKD